MRIALAVLALALGGCQSNQPKSDLERCDDEKTAEYERMYPGQTSSRESVRGVMRPGDAMVLYTDGLVETAKREIELGIDRLIGEVEKALHASTPDRVDRLVERLGTKDDDRAKLLVHRSA